MPSVDEAAIVPGPLATATKTPFPYVTEFQKDELGKVPVVQFTPSEDVKTVFELFVIATNIPFP